MNATQDIQDTVKNTFNFEVKKYPLTGPDNVKTDLFGLFRSDNFELVGNSSVKERYTPHTTDDVLAIVDAASECFDNDIDVKCNFRHGHYVTIAPSDDYRRKICGSDVVFPRVMVNASYDGRAFRATMGLYRDMCKNLMMMNEVKATSHSIRHTSGLRSKMDELIETFELLKSSWNDLGEAIDFMNNRRVNMRDFIIDVYGLPDENSSKSRTMHEKRIEAIYTRLQRESIKSGHGIPDKEVSGWLAYNAIQGYSQHDAIRRSTTTDFDRILLSNQDSNVLKAQKLILAS